jgi:hypothetical protein
VVSHGLTWRAVVACPPQDLAACFPEFQHRLQETGGCQYRDCLHMLEPGCVITGSGSRRGGVGSGSGAPPLMNLEGSSPPPAEDAACSHNEPVAESQQELGGPHGGAASGTAATGWSAGQPCEPVARAEAAQSAGSAHPNDYGFLEDREGHAVRIDAGGSGSQPLMPRHPLYAKLLLEIQVRASHLVTICIMKSMQAELWKSVFSAW